MEKNISKEAKLIKDEINNKGYISFMVKTENTPVDVYLDELRTAFEGSNLTITVVKEITLDNKPLSALVLVTVKVPIKENITNEQANKMIEDFMVNHKLQEEFVEHDTKKEE